MIVDRARFFIGLGLMISFAIVLAIILSPVFNGQTGLDFLDNTYNSISKGSSYYIPEVRERYAAFAGNDVAVTLRMESEDQAQLTARLLDPSGTVTVLEPTQLRYEGDLGGLLDTCADDSDLMYANDSESIAAKYGYDGKRALFNWWSALHEMERDLKRQKMFEEAEITALVVKKAVEPAYNYHGIEAQHISEKLWTVVFSLAFYVVYTVWYGFAFMFMFEGWGMKLKH